MPPLRCAVIIGAGLGLHLGACAKGLTDDSGTGDTGDAAGPSANDAAGEGTVNAPDAADASTDGPLANDLGSSGDTSALSEAGDDAVGSGDGDAAPDAPADAIESGPNPDVGATARIVFVSSALYDGNLNGLSGADMKCQTLAMAAGLTGTYEAWLSDSTTSAAFRLTHASVPYVLVDGTVVAQNWNALISGGDLLHAIDETESGGPPPVGTFQCGGSDPLVWTYTDPSGNPLGGGSDCSDWKSSTVAAAFTGAADIASWPNWTQDCQSGPGLSASTCADTAALYCVQQ
jgi:hypothetical protein